MACPPSVVNCPDRQKINQIQPVSLRNGNTYEEAKKKIQAQHPSQIGGITIKTTRA